MKEFKDLSDEELVDLFYEAIIDVKNQVKYEEKILKEIQDEESDTL